MPIVVVLPERRFPGAALLALHAALRDEGTAAVLAAPRRGRCHGTGGVAATVTVAIGELNPAAVEALVVLDGHERTLARDPALAALLRAVRDEGRVVCGVGDGVLALAGAGLLRGRAAASDDGLAELLRREGAVPLREAVVVDAPFITATAAAAAQAGRELIAFRGVPMDARLPAP